MLPRGFCVSTQAETQVQDKKAEYSSMVDVVAVFLKSCYHYSGKCEKHYSYDPRQSRIVPYSRDLPIGIHLRGDVYNVDKTVVAISGLEFVGDRQLVVEVELSTVEKVVVGNFSIKMYRYAVEGWKHEKQAWAIAYSVIKRYNLSNVSDYVIFPHYFRGRKAKYDAMFVIAFAKNELEQVELWFRRSVVDLLAPQKEEKKEGGEEKSIEELIKEVEELVEGPEELSLTPAVPPATQVTTAVVTDVEVERLRKELEELKEIVEKRFDEWAKKQGLVKAKLVVFDLPTEYLRSTTKYEKNGETVMETKILKLDPARLRTLRKTFYTVLHKLAYKVDGLWILRHNADLSELNEVMGELHRILVENNISEKRTINLVDVYLPKDYVVEGLKEYIEERRMVLRDVQTKLETVLKLSERRRLEKELSNLLDEVKRLEEELRYLSS